MGWFSRINAVPKVARIASGKRVYAVGDIHGRNDLLERLLKQILEDAALAPAIEKILIFLGDYVDRGPASKAVLDTLSNLKWPDWKIVFLRGNHDQAVLDFFQDSNSYRGWRSYGAAETLLSYGVLPPRLEREADFDKAKQELAQRLPQSHLEF
jgi:serine/threonine protein phosphatase 1